VPRNSTAWRFAHRQPTAAISNRQREYRRAGRQFIQGTPALDVINTGKIYTHFGIVKWNVIQRVNIDVLVVCKTAKPPSKKLALLPMECTA
jgi:hypothetical protein